MTRGFMPKPPPGLPLKFHYAKPECRLGLIPPTRLSAASATWLRQHARHLANVRDDKELHGVWFTRSPARPDLDPFFPDFEPGSDGGTRKPPSERTLKLGKTIRVLHDRLPTLLISPLPTEILSPQITLNLFPSTHPHLPSVRGRIAYSAALWTAPVAWGRVPLVGNVKLHIISERMIKNGTHAQLYNNHSGDAQNEELIVRWRTCGKNSNRQQLPFSSHGASQSSANTLDRSSRSVSSVGEEAEEFSGLFIFQFDSEGRILSHTIEHTEQGGNWEKMTSRVINVTDWLLGRAKWRQGNPEEGLALGYGVCKVEHDDVRWRLRGRRDCRDLGQSIPAQSYHF